MAVSPLLFGASASSALAQTPADTPPVPKEPAQTEPQNRVPETPRATRVHKAKPKTRITKPKPERAADPTANADHKADDKKSDDKKPPAAPATLAAAAASGANAAPLDIAARLKQAGAAGCAATIDEDAVPSMIGVTQSNTVSTWSNVEPRDKHAVNVFVGQRYGGSQTVPFGVTGLIASPNASGSCDSTVIQIVASPLPCANVRETLLRQGKPGGDLAGIPLIQSAQDQTLLMPTATNTCVLVGFHSTYRK